MYSAVAIALLGLMGYAAYDAVRWQRKDRDKLRNPPKGWRGETGARRRQKGPR